MKNLAPLMERMAIAAEKIEKSQSTQVEIVQQLGVAMRSAGTKEFIRSLTTISRTTQEIVGGMKSLNESSSQAISEMTKEAAKATETFNEFHESIKGASDAALELGRSKLIGSMEELGKKIEETSDATKEFTLSSKDLEKTHRRLPEAIGATSAALTGLRAVFKGVISLIGSIIGLAFKLVGTLFKVARGIIGLPFRVLEGIVNMANAAASGSSEWAEAIRELKMEYGALNQAAPAAIMSMARDTKGLSQTGLNAYAVFGTVAERMKEFNKLGQEMGAVFENFTDEFAENGAALVNWQKGLGLSGEQMGNMARYAQTMGTSMTEEFLEVQKQVYALAEVSGIATKHIARDYAKAIADVKTWGGATKSQIMQSIVYIRKLGVEVEKVAGIMETFSTFEGAAEAASKLSQAFGVALDPLAAVGAQDPTAVIEDLRKQFAAGGIDVSKFDRASKRLLATTVGLDEATAQQIFSLENQGLSLDQIKKKSAEAEKKQLSQAEAMKQLAASIEKLVRSGSREGGFLSQFIKGFGLGIERSGAFRKMIWNVSRALRETYLQGIRLGRAFAESFPGVKKFFGGIADLFNPTRFRKFIRGVTDELILLVKGKKSFPEVMDEVKKRFFDFWDPTSGPGKKILGGAKDFLVGISKLAGGIIEWIAKSIGKLINDIIDLATGEKKIDLSGAAKGAGGIFMEIISPLIESLIKAGDSLGPPIERAYTILKDKAVKYFNETIVPAFENMAGPLANALFGPIFVRAVIGALAYVLASAAFSGIGTFIKNKLFAGKAGPIDPKAGSAASGFSMGSVMKLALGLGALAALVYIGVVPLAERLKEVAKILDKTEPEDLMKAMGVVVLIIVGAVAMAGAAWLLSKMDPASLTAGVIVLSILTAVIAAVSAIVLGIISFGSPEKLAAAGTFMTAMTEVFIMMAPLALAASALGLIIAGSFGIFAALVATGLAGMTAMITKVAVTAKDIMNDLEKMPIGPQFKEKLDAFTSIMKLINEFATIILKLIAAAKPEFNELKKEENKKTFVDNINKMIEFVDRLVGKKDPPTGIIGIIETVKEAVKEIGRDPDFIKAGPVFQAVLEGVAAVLKAMTPPPELIEAQSGFWNAVGDLFRSNADEVGQQTANYIEKMGEYAVPIIGALKGMVTDILKAAELIPSQEKAVAAGGVIAAIAGLVQAVMPNKEVMAALSKSMQRATFIEGTFSPVDPTSSAPDLTRVTKEMVFDAKAAAEFFGTFMKEVKPVILDLTSNLIPELLKIANTMTSSQLEKLKMFVDIFSAFSGIVKSINDGIVEAKKVPEVKIEGGIGSDIQVNINGNAERALDYVGILSGLGGVFGTLMSKLQSAVQDVPADWKFKTQLDRAKIMIEMLAMLPEMANAFKDVPPLEGSGFGVLEGMRTVLTFLDIITDPKQNKGISLLQEMGALIVKVNSDITQNIGGRTAAGVVDKVLKFVENITKLVGGLKGIIEVSKEFSPTDARGAMKKVAEAIEAISSKEGIVMPTWGQVDKCMAAAGTDESSPIQKIADAFKEKDISKLSGIVANIETFAKRMGRITKALQDNPIADAVTELTALNTQMGVLRLAMPWGLNLSLGLTFGDKNKGTAGNITLQEDMGTTVDRLVGVVRNLSRLAKKGAADLDIAGLPKIIEDLSINLKQTKDTLATHGIKEGLQAINDMTDLANDLSGSLKNLPNLKLGAKLQAFAKGIGVGGNFKYKIEAPNVNIKVDLAVMIDAKQLEASIIYREMSVIRDRINGLVKQTGQTLFKDNEIPANPRTPVSVPGVVP